MRITPIYLRSVLFIVLLVGASCSNESGSGLSVVKGKVLFNKQPAAGVTVTFHLQGGDPVKSVRPVGRTKEDGAFSLMSGDKDGAAPGDYIVTLIWPEEVKSKQKGELSTEPADSRDRLDGRYADPGRSQFKAQVKAGPNEIEPFHLK